MTRTSTIWRIVICALVLMTGVLGFARDPQESFLLVDVKGKGRITIQLFTDKAPKTTARIKELAMKKFYDGQKFFKVITKPRPFLAQFGDPLTKTKDLNDESIGTGGTGVTLPLEDTGIHHGVGAVGLSRLPEDPNSGDCQFYIMLGEAGFLDGKYCVFGQVTKDSLELLKRLDAGDVVTTVRVQEGK